MVNAALAGELAGAEYVSDPVFGVDVPVAVPGVPREVLRPRDTWADGAAYDAAAAELAAMFKANFEQFADQVSDAVKTAGPP
jgi:phosphoenolpyruvate carboxykinase (ATP)